MKVFSRHIGWPVLAGALLFSSCIRDTLSECEIQADSATDTRARMTLNLVPLSLGTANADVTEMIKSLRVIIINETTLEDGTTERYVEYNQYFNFSGDPENGDMFSGPGEPAAGFRYIITRNTVPGLKKFYLVANETSVNSVNFQTTTALPEGIEAGMTLHDFLDFYSEDYIADLDYPHGAPQAGAPKGTEFETLVNSLYYTPEFLQQQKQTGVMDEEGETPVYKYEIFLPYTSYYTYSLISKEQLEAGEQGSLNMLDGVMYLIPAATKFRFKFQNYRDQDVEIPSLFISGLASDMYLFAQVDLSKEGEKTFNGKKMWWVDWLAAVALESQKPDYDDKTSNDIFNSRVGWINNFTVPASAYPSATMGEYEGEERPGMIQLVQNENFTVPHRVSGDPVTGVPGTSWTGYFYFPESRNMVKQNVTDENGNVVSQIDVQRYNLTITMKETLLDAESAVRDTPIGNLGSMFRDTNTLITIVMRDSKDVGAYAQIEPWSVTHTNGNVIEDNSPL